MNQKIKSIGLLAVLPLALVMLSPNLVGDANATNIGSQDIIGRPGYQPDKVCGDRLCSGENGPNIGTQNGIGRPGYQPDKVCGDRLCSEDVNSAKNGQTPSPSSIASEYDALSMLHAEKTQELNIANAYDDFKRASELQDVLIDLRSQLAELKGN